MPNRTPSANTRREKLYLKQRRNAVWNSNLRQIVGALLLLALALWPVFTVQNESCYNCLAMQREVVVLPPRMDNPIALENDADSTVTADFHTTITVSAAGDCVLGRDDTQGYEGSFVYDMQQRANDYGWCFRRVLPYFARDDLTIVNFEGTLTDATERKGGKYCFKGDASYASILKAGSVEMVGLGNNHSRDFGDEGFNDTVDALRGAGIDFAGNGLSCTREVNGVKVGFLSYYNQSTDARTLINDVAALRNSDCRLIICALHWGEEYNNNATYEQQILGHAAIDAGADLVLGTHPHVIGPIENYKGKYIVYSLGNFVFGGNKNPPDYDTFIFQQTFSVSASGAEDAGVRLIPCSLSSVSDRNDYQPKPYTGTDAERVLARINGYSSKLEYGAQFAAEDVLS